MKLEEQNYLLYTESGLKTVTHTELLGEHKQIVRLKETFHDTLTQILNDNLSVSLYNHYNPINSDLIRHFRSKPENNNTAMVGKIVNHTNSEPILDETSLRVVQVLEMNNIWFEDILDEDLKLSLPFYGMNTNGDLSVANLNKWLSQDFYGGNISVEDIEKLQKLFFRKIKLLK